MTLSFEEKKAIFDDYEELTAVPVSMNRINYHFNASAVDHKIVVRFLHPNGNAFIYAGYLPKEETDKGCIGKRRRNDPFPFGKGDFLLEKNRRRLCGRLLGKMGGPVRRCSVADLR